MFASSAKLEWADNTWEGRADIQRGLDSLEKWAGRNLRKYIKDKCEMQQYRLGTKRIESSFAEK